MSQASERFKQHKPKILDALTESFSPVDRDQPTHNHLLLNTTLLISLIFTMLPLQAVVTFFSFSALLTATVTSIAIIKGSARISRPMSAMIAALTLTSILSGCAPALFSGTSPELYQLIKDRKYKSHTLQKIGVFGLGLEDLTIEKAQFDGDIETVFVAKLEQGYGLISFGRVIVAGK